MNAVDFVLLATIVGIVGAGFFHGVVKVSTSIVAIYVATIGAAMFYRPVTAGVKRWVSSLDRETGELICFFLLLLLFSAGFTWLGARLVSGVRLPRRVRILDNISGAVVGVVVSTLAMVVLAMYLTVADQVFSRVGAQGGGAVATALQRGIEGSELVPVFLELAPLFSDLLSPWFPGGLPPILNNAV